ncbi:MAG: trehalose-phosphatase [Acidimicrobiales bacterium]
MSGGAGDLPAALAPLRARPAAAAVFCDFDGTLAPIVPDPATARPLPGVPALLETLAGTYGLVAVVSGRPAAYLAAMLGDPAKVRLVGLYGMEEVVDRRVVVPDEVAAWRPVVEAVTGRAAAAAPSGVGVEPKGLAMTLHWRGHPELAGWVEGFVADERRRTGLVAQPGRMAIELRPPVGSDKGTVVTGLARGYGAAVFFGDDLGDLAAFEALGALAAGGMAVARVAVTDDESPPEVAAAADVVVEGPAGALRLLELLAERPAGGA